MIWWCATARKRYLEAFLMTKSWYNSRKWGIGKDICLMSFMWFLRGIDATVTSFNTYSFMTYCYITNKCTNVNRWLAGGALRIHFYILVWRCSITTVLVSKSNISLSFCCYFSCTLIPCVWIVLTFLVWLNMLLLLLLKIFMSFWALVWQILSSQYQY